MAAVGTRVEVKRVYEKPLPSDGTRVLVDRLWPRGLTKDRADIDAWFREVAPSGRLRTWFHSHPLEWPSFRQRYLKELSCPKGTSALDELYRLVRGKKQVTLLFASRNQEHNNAVVLKDLLNGMRKPPTGTGPAGARVARPHQAKGMSRR
ncbi:MAG TPA: DUF488 family protein [Terriglobales bacterium]|jgi:uncharacterized protein YeaO (DUF488 family)|nr:DUF488 family protein [Terriglobales bacterium]